MLSDKNVTYDLVLFNHSRYTVPVSLTRRDTVFHYIWFQATPGETSEMSDEACRRAAVPKGRRTMRTYPPGTALFVDGKFLCGGPGETIHEYVPPPGAAAETVSRGADDGNNCRAGSPKTHSRRTIGSYGSSLAFSGDVRTLDLLTAAAAAPRGL